MSDEQQQTAQPTNGGERQVSAEELEIRSNHKQALAKIESQRETEMARIDAEMTTRMPVALRMFFDDRLYQRATLIAERMATAVGFTPAHLIDKPGACFAVISKALAWNLDPFSVAQSTYAVGGRVAYEGRLVQAILEASGRLKGGIHARYIGDWSKVDSKFKIEGGKPVRAWSDADEDGLGIVLRVHLHGEEAPREFTFYLKQCWPRNASTWPTRPRQQLHYNAIRAFASVAAPSLLLGVPFHEDVASADPQMRDITPKAPDPVDLNAEGIRGGGTLEEEKSTSSGESTASEPVKQASQHLGETVDPVTGEVTEAQPKRQRRSYRQITDAVIAMLSDAETERDVDEILADEVTSGVRVNTALMAEITAAELAARHRINEVGADRAAPQQNAQPSPQQSARPADEAAGPAQQATAGQPATNLFPQG